MVPCPALPQAGSAGGLPNTGFPLIPVLLAAALLVTAGLALLMVGRRRAHWPAVIVLGVLVISMSVGRVQSAAADPVCPPLEVSIVQTSVNTGLAPGVPGSLLTGVVRNESAVDIYVTDVTVAIGEVTRPQGESGPCGPGDYRLGTPRMPVGTLLHPGASAPFSGATIGFVDRPVNQNACRGARLLLQYVSS